jgi:hypothetical protein
VTKIREVEAYPLSWPEGWTRTASHLRKAGSQFVTRETVYQDNHSWKTSRAVTPDYARRLLVDELGRLKARGMIISTNVPLRADGEMHAGAARVKISDPGVAVYFQLKGKPMVMAADAYDNIAANLRSLGLAIEALRQLERHGGGVMMERAFAGFTSLPAPEGSAPKRPWWTVLNYGEDPETRLDLSVDEVKARYRTLAKRRHPDSDGGSHELMSELNEALVDAERDLGG